MHLDFLIFVVFDDLLLLDLLFDSLVEEVENLEQVGVLDDALLVLFEGDFGVAVEVHFLEDESDSVVQLLADFLG